jgi:hypothetical protein
VDAGHGNAIASTTRLSAPPECPVPQWDFVDYTLLPVK